MQVRARPGRWLRRVLAEAQRARIEADLEGHERDSASADRFCRASMSIALIGHVDHSTGRANTVADACLARPVTPRAETP